MTPSHHRQWHQSIIIIMASKKLSFVPRKSLAPKKSMLTQKLGILGNHDDVANQEAERKHLTDDSDSESDQEIFAHGSIKVHSLSKRSNRFTHASTKTDKRIQNCLKSYVQNYFNQKSTLHPSWSNFKCGLSGLSTFENWCEKPKISILHPSNCAVLPLT